MFYSPLIRTSCLLVMIAGLGFLTGYLCLHESYLTVFLCICMMTIIGIKILRQQRKTTRMFNRMLEDIRYHDFSLHYSYVGKSRTEKEMASKVNQVIDELKKVHLNYEEQSHYYKTLLDTIDSCIVVSDPSGKIIWTNRSAEKQLCGHAFHSIDELATLDKKFPHLLHNMKPGDIKAIRTYKEDLAIDWAITLTEYLKKGIYYRLYHLRNIRLLLEENEMEAWQKLVRVLTHEIMNSIAPIISLSETLVDYIPQEEKQSFDSSEFYSDVDREEEEEEDGGMGSNQIIQHGLETIHRRSKGLLEFVENYRKLTRISSPVLAPVSVSELLMEIQGLFEDKSISFESIDRDHILMIDRIQIEQVLINLIKNAREACEGIPDPKISIHSHYHEESGVYFLSVTDNGKGIIAEALDRIFVPFFTTKPTGSGIGLSICKQIMMLHRGTISVSSVPNKGTTFTLKFVNMK